MQTTIPPPREPPIQGRSEWFNRTWWRFFSGAELSANQTKQTAQQASAAAGAAQTTADAALAMAMGDAAVTNALSKVLLQDPVPVMAPIIDGAAIILATLALLPPLPQPEVVAVTIIEVDLDVQWVYLGNTNPYTLTAGIAVNQQVMLHDNLGLGNTVINGAFIVGNTPLTSLTLSQVGQGLWCRWNGSAWDVPTWVGLL
jgi:hypothetical protein